MLREFKGRFIQLTAESNEDNIALLQVNQEKKTKIVSKYTGKKRGRKAKPVEDLELKRSNLELLKSEFSTIARNSTKLISNELAIKTDNFSSYAYWYFMKDKRIPVSIARVPEGYMVTIK